MINYNRTQDIWPVFPYQSLVRIPLVDGLKMQEMGESPQQLLDQGVRVDWNKTLDKRVYTGVGNYPGLVNNPGITSTALPATGVGSSTHWSAKTPELIREDFDFMAMQIWNASGNAPEALPNRFLVSPARYEALLQPMVLGGAGGFASVKEYLMKSSMLNSFGVEPEIYPLPVWLETVGTGAVPEIVAYKFDEDCMSIRLAVDIQRFGGPLSVVEGAYEVTYVGNIGIVKINRPQTVQYFYGA